MNTYTFNYKVRLDDLDYMGIVGNSEWLTFLTRARIELLDQIKFPFSEMAKQKIGGVVAEANIKFLKPAFFDDQLTIKVMPHSPFNKGLSLNHIVENQKKMECLVADIKIIFVNHKGEAVSMPQTIVDRLFTH